MAIARFNVEDVTSENYPVLVNNIASYANIEFFDEHDFEDEVQAYYVPTTKTIHVNSEVLAPSSYEEMIRQFSILAHEFSHWLMDKIGFTDKFRDIAAGDDLEIGLIFLDELIAYTVSEMLRGDVIDNTVNVSRAIESSVFTRALYMAAYDLDSRYPGRMKHLEEWYKIYVLFDLEIEHIYSTAVTVLETIGLKVVQNNI